MDAPNGAGTMRRARRLRSAVLLALGTFAVASTSIGDWGIWRQLAVALVGSLMVAAANLPTRARTFSPTYQEPTLPHMAGPVPPPTRWLTLLTRLAAQVLIIAAAIAVLGYLIGFGVRFLTDRMRPPADASNATILDAVHQKLVMCAKASVVEPTGCPQRYYASAEEAVSWSMHGDPLDGADVEWNPFSKEFDVYGIAVMLVRYTVPSGSEVDVVNVGYHATVQWDGKPLIRSVEGEYEGDLVDSRIDRQAGDKTRPIAPESDFHAALRQAFDHCISFRTASQPPECPVHAYHDDDMENIRWSVVADPLLNATLGYDDRFGLVTITGDYVLRMDYDERYSGPDHNEYSGQYEATLIIENGAPLVLRIRDLDD